MSPQYRFLIPSKFAKNNVATVRTLLDSALELDVRLIACQMTVDVFDYGDNEFLDGVEFGGAAAFMSEARRSQVTLFI